jgi:hypothetical protein
MSADYRSLIEVLEGVTKGIQDESARYWIHTAIRHLAEGRYPRQIAAAAACLREAAHYTQPANLRPWLQSLASYLEKEAWS